ncbi:MAG TPA: YetF domain-containing protein [Candidatus Limnocylindria bacterium]|nr:YetF domain-containing protein [Candidatus Limnocylindria bacterium]
MLTTTVPLWEIILRTAIVYIVVLGLLRLGGKRELGQMSPADFVVILIIANAVQNAMNGGDVSLVAGIASAATLLGMNYALGRFGRGVPFLGRLFAEEPTLLLQDGKIIENALEREHVEIQEIEMAAREHGIADLGDVAAAVLEVDGSISIIPKSGDMHRSRRRFRQFRSRP